MEQGSCAVPFSEIAGSAMDLKSGRIYWVYRRLASKTDKLKHGFGKARVHA